jgi:carbonic anhydrase
MLTFENDHLHAKLREEAGSDATDIDFRPFPDVDESVRSSLNAIRESPHLPDSLELSGWVYDVRSGRLSEVAQVGSPA